MGKQYHLLYNIGAVEKNIRLGKGKEGGDGNSSWEEYQAVGNFIHPWLKEKDFSGVSVTAEKWLPIEVGFPNGSQCAEFHERIQRILTCSLFMRATRFFFPALTIYCYFTGKLRYCKVLFPKKLAGEYFLDWWNSLFNSWLEFLDVGGYVHITSLGRVMAHNLPPYIWKMREVKV